MRHLLLLLIALSPGACGYKGPLYLPTSKPDAGGIVIPPTAPERPIPSESVPAPQ